MKNTFYILSVLLIFLAPLTGLAQPAQDSLAGSEIIKLAPDSDSLNSDNLNSDSLNSDTLSKMTPHEILIDEMNISGNFKMQKSTLGAVWRSFVVPGWGQIYVESYWKAPLFFGASAGLVGLIIYNNSLYQDFALQIDNLAEPTDSELAILKSKREFYRDQRDMSAFYLLGVYVLAAVDAYVGAHLYDFNVDDNISAGIAPGRNSFVAIRINYHF